MLIHLVEQCLHNQFKDLEVMESSNSVSTHLILQDVEDYSSEGVGLLAHMMHKAIHFSKVQTQTLK